MERQEAFAASHGAMQNHSNGTFTSGPLTHELVPEIERIIGLLGKQRFLRLSLFRFQIDGLSPTAAMNLVTRALKPQGVVGVLPDGAIGFLYLGPRGKGMVADLALVHHIRERVRAEIHRQSPFNEMRLTSLLVAHRWADEVIDAYDLVDALHQQNTESAKAS
jgi:hypothetical protein